MQGYYEIEAQIPLNHHLSLQLPDSIPVGVAKIAVIPTTKNGQFKKRVIDKTGVQNLADLKSRWLNAT